MANMKNVEATIGQYNSASFSFGRFDDRQQVAPLENSRCNTKGIGLVGHAFDT